MNDFLVPKKFAGIIFSFKQLYNSILPETDSFSFVAFLLLSLSVIILSTIIFFILKKQKQLSTERDELINNRLVKIERENLQLKSEFDLYMRQNYYNEKLISFISHDLRSPMCSLLNTSSIFNYYIKKNDYNKLIATSSEIDLTIKNINNMLDNLLNWYSSNKGKIINNPTAFKLDDLVQKCFEVHDEYAQSKSIRITYEKWEDIFIYADFNLVYESVKNILCNAIKYSAENSNIIFKVSKTDKEVIINIIDSGTGISESMIQTLGKGVQFNPEPGTRGEKGFGLGIAVSKKFINECKGTITLDSANNVGTNVSIKLPLAIQFS